MVISNLQLAFPEKSKEEIDNITQQFYRHFCDQIFETIKLRTISKAELIKRFKFVNPELIAEDYKNGKHILGVLGHYTNWEWGMSIGVQVPYTFTSIYKPLSNKYFDRLMTKTRTRFGNEVVPMSQTARLFMENIKNNKLTMLNFLADQSPMRHEVQYWTTFFNQKTAVYLGLEKLALKTKQPVYFAHFSKIKRGYYSSYIEKICDDANTLKPHELTDIHTRLLENDIRSNPQYWLWTHRRWKLKPENQ